MQQDDPFSLEAFNEQVRAMQEDSGSKFIECSPERPLYLRRVNNRGDIEIRHSLSAEQEGGPWAVIDQLPSEGGYDELIIEFDDGLPEKSASVEAKWLLTAGAVVNFIWSLWLWLCY